MENLKHKLRKDYRLIRKKISLKRRTQAMHALNAAYTNLSGLICSYAGFGDELDTSFLNASLLSKGCLVLPKIEGNQLSLYLVNALEDLEINSFGIPEPKTRCKRITKNDLAVVLVPGVVFDSCNHRLGYGKGFYDAFLNGENIFTIGIGFKECLSDKKLPTHGADVPLKELSLF